MHAVRAAGADASVLVSELASNLESIERLGHGDIVPISEADLLDQLPNPRYRRQKR